MSSSVFEGVPTFFRALCYHAARQSQGQSYLCGGSAFMGALHSLVPTEAEFEESEEEMEQLAALLERKDFARVESWFANHFPNCMAIVPHRRRVKFLEGVYRQRLEDSGYAGAQAAEMAAMIKLPSMA